MIKKIKLLTNIFLKDYYQNLNIINKKNNKLNKKSAFTWLMIIFVFALIYLSLKAIDFFQQTGVPILFLKIYLPIIATMMIIQLISLVCKVLFYSKDLEYIMPLPINKIEILISKLNTVIIIMYFMEMIYLLVPLSMYGILVEQTIGFFISMIITLVSFPIVFVATVSIVMLFIMKLSKFIKNQDLFQVIVVFVLSFMVSFVGINYIEKIVLEPNQENLSRIQIIEMKADEINKVFLVINPIIKILENNNLIEKLVNFIKIIIISIIPVIIFITIGKRLYLQNILQNKNIRINMKIKTKNKYRLKNKKIEYIKKDIKKIIKNPSCFTQFIFQYLFLVFAAIVFLNIFTPIYIDQIIESKMLENMPIDDFKLQSILIVVGILQLIFTFSNLSITAISREGKNAYFMKYIPMSLYEQLKIKILPQICLNAVVILMILTTIYLKVTEITFGYYIIAFIVAMILNILNSYIMILIDLKNPNLNWINEESISKNNGNKLYQYVITIFICLILSYFANIFEDINFIISIISIISILLIAIIILKKYIKKNINKLFKKIN